MCCMKRGMVFAIVVCIIASMVFAQSSLQIDCEQPDTVSVPYATVTCTLERPGSGIVQVCAQEVCKGILVEESISVPVQIKNLYAGDNEYVISVSGPSESSSDTVSINYNTAPVVELVRASHPATVEYSDEFDLELEFKVNSRAKPRDVVIFLRDREIYRADGLEATTLSVRVDASLLYRPLEVTAIFMDDAEVRYEMSWPLDVELSNLNTLDKISLFFRRMFSRVAG